MKLYEEFREYENLWDDEKALTESADKAYSALMKVQDYIQNLEGWEIIDCQQDDEYSMTIKCDSEYDIEEFVADIEEFSMNVGVDVSVNWSDHKGYDVIVYLNYMNLFEETTGQKNTYKETRYKVIMVVDDEEYTYGTYESRNRANEVAMQVRDERGIDVYVEEE